MQTEVALLRVAQGALADVREHAGAHTVVVTLSYLGDVVTPDVCDNGRGFDPRAVTPGARLTRPTRPTAPLMGRAARRAD
ncbi:hypothetical protein AB0I60_13505 [Actinosynnema sp. NPDC050436]|uniref:hypothetical protein n=1 Tax=Actinosynnema sp. NPDC050436 TaxID=3155659 RepID=UPI0033C979E0